VLEREQEAVVMPNGEENHREQDGVDGVHDASVDSFPASDPPSWTGMRIGGPRRGSVVPAATPPARTDDSLRARLAPASPPSVVRWLEGQWPRVHVCFAEVLLADSDSRERRARLRAVVQLGGLTPADVQVTARLAVAGSEFVSREPLRLWSVQSHHNGAFVFEAAAATEAPLTIEGAPDLLVTVAPAPPERAGLALSDVVRLVASGEPADCASPARFPHALLDASAASPLGASRAG
jgi:hypothetical protein